MLDSGHLAFGPGDGEPSLSVAALGAVFQMGGERFGLLSHPVGQLRPQETESEDSVIDLCRITDQ
jgi:hypothetical protein